MSEPIPVWYTSELMSQRDDLIRQLRRIEDILIQNGELKERSVLNREERRALRALLSIESIDT